MQATKGVKNPRKQRKNMFNAPAHIRHKFMAAPLAKELAKSKGAKTLPVRKGDTVRILRGDNKGFEGKVSRIDLKNFRVYIEGLTREKVDGTNIFIGVHPSKVLIKNLNLDDDLRKAVVERKLAPEKQKEAKKQKKAKAKEKAPKVEAAKEETPNQEVSVKAELEKPALKKKSAAKKAAKPAKKSVKSKKALKKSAKSGAKRKTATKTKGEQ